MSPAPSRRNVGASLATKIANGRHTDNLADRRDQRAANRERHAQTWEGAVALLENPLLDGREKPVPIRADVVPAVIDHGAWSLVLAVPCRRHGAAIGQACWEAPRGMCSARVLSTRYRTKDI